jgi:LytR cell envelope-related transcriptional attenuator/cell envelope-related transcriptional attenuator-like protein
VSLGEPPVTPTRAARHARRPRRGPILAIVGLLVVAAVFVAVVATRGEDPTPSVTPTGSSTIAATPSDLVLISVKGADAAFVGVAGSGGGRDPAAIVVDPGTTIVVPGQGETVLEDLADQAGDSVRIGVANAIGAWIPHYLVTDLDGLTAIVDRAGGLTVNVPEAQTVNGRVIGPGDTRLNGDTVAAYLRAPGDDAGTRWATVFEAILEQVPAIQQSDLLETDDVDASTAALTAARGALVEPLPTETVLASVLVLHQPDADTLVQERFGTTEPDRAFVQNGSGAPGVGEDVARLIVPEGFRIVLSGNAEDFHHEQTQVIASTNDDVDLAEEIADALGVGLVEVAQVPSGLADVTIVVGKDFEG